MHASAQWSRCRKIWGSGSQRSNHQTVSDYTLGHRFPYTQQSRFLTACRRLEKLVLPSIFDTYLMMWNLHSYPTTVLNEKCDIFGGSKHTLTTPTHFQWVKTKYRVDYSKETFVQLRACRPAVRDPVYHHRCCCVDVVIRPLPTGSWYLILR